MTRPHRRWTSERLDTLRKLYGVVATDTLAVLLETSPAAIRQKARAAGISQRANVEGRVLALLDEIAILRRLSS